MSRPWTEGPWGVDPNVTPDERLICDDATGSVVCGVWPHGEIGETSTMDANARLIAAAPDLYEALEECRAAMARYDYDVLDADELMPASERDLRKRVDAVLSAANPERDR